MNMLRTSAPTIAVVALVALTRLIPHWPNFTPVMAVALCGGVLFTNRLQALFVAVGAMIISDLALGTVFGVEYAFHGAQPWVYGCVVATALLGHALRDASSFRQIAIGGTISSLGFFLVTNFAVWLQGSFYPSTLDGLVMCYAAGLAFYRDGGNFLLNGMISTYVFSMFIIFVGKALQPRVQSIRS
ncbi:MAG: DUF6580 family putative transport protein [Ignavibacteria bacterium]|jgi:hypothetical protein